MSQSAPDMVTQPPRAESRHWVLALLVPSLFALLSPDRSGFTLAHLVAIATTPVWLPRLWRDQRLRRLLVLAGLASLAVITSDLVHRVSPVDTVVSLAFLVAVVVGLGLFVWLLDYCSAPLVMAVGVGLALCVQVLLSPSVNFAGNPWKYGLAGPVTLVAVATAAWMLGSGRRYLVTALLLVLVMLSLSSGFRSWALICGVLVVSPWVVPRLQHLNLRRVILVSIAILGLGISMYVGYQWLASTGRLGAEQEARWQLQSQSKGGLLIGARPEVFIARTVISDSPIIGQGSRADPSSALRQAALASLSRTGTPIGAEDYAYYFGGGLYLHSVLLQFWASAGPVAALPLLYSLFLVYAGLLRAARSPNDGQYLLVLFFALSLTWDTLFSPLVALYPVMLALGVTIAVRSQFIDPANGT